MLNVECCCCCWCLNVPRIPSESMKKQYQKYVFSSCSSFFIKEVNTYDVARWCFWCGFVDWMNVHLMLNERFLFCWICRAFFWDGEFLLLFYFFSWNFHLCQLWFMLGIVNMTSAWVIIVYRLYSLRRHSTCLTCLRWDFSSRLYTSWEYDLWR